MENTLDKPKAQDLRTTRDPTRAREMARKSLASGNRKPRGLSKATITREQALLNVQQTIIERSMKLAYAQSMLGLGTIRVYRIDSHYEQFGKTKKLVKHKPVIVDDDDEITAVLDHEYSGASSPDTETQFYFVEVQEPNNTAIDSQLNRVFGKARESIDVTSNGQSIAPVIVGMRIIDNSIRTSEVVQQIESVERTSELVKDNQTISNDVSQEVGTEGVGL